MVMTRLKDIVHQTPNPAEVSRHLCRLADTCLTLSQEIEIREDRSNRLVAYANFARYIGGELRRTAGFYPNDVPGLAWAARNLFEVHLLVKYISQSDKDLSDWMGQGITDETDFIDGILFFSEPGESQSQIALLQAQRARLLDMAERHHLKKVKPFRVSDLAENLGEADEYAALFRLYSKYVHPSSLYINKWALQRPDPTFIEIFSIKAQVYAAQAIRIIQDNARK